MTCTRSLSAFAAAIVAPSLAIAQTASSDPAGRYPLVLAVAPGATTSSASNGVAVPALVRRAAFRGAPLSKEQVAATPSGTTLKLNFPAGTFTPAQFDPTTTTTYYIELDNGQPQTTDGPWRWSGSFCNVVTTSDSSVTLADESLLNAVVVGTTVISIRPHWTPGTLFGDQNSAGLTSANTASTSDYFSVVNPATGAGTTIFFRTNTSLNIHEWRLGINTNATNYLIPPNRILLTQRKGETALNAPILGEIKTVGTCFDIPAPAAATNVTYGWISNPYPFPSQTLAALGLYTGSAQTGLLGGTSEEDSPDTIVLQSTYLQGTAAVMTVYHFNTTNNRWQRGSVDATNDRIPAGTAAYIARKPASVGQAFTFFLRPPAEVLPYAH